MIKHNQKIGWNNPTLKVKFASFIVQMILQCNSWREDHTSHSWRRREDQRQGWCTSNRWIRLQPFQSQLTSSLAGGGWIVTEGSSGKITGGSSQTHTATHHILLFTILYNLSKVKF